jgi:hypothetical protein
MRTNLTSITTGITSTLMRMTRATSRGTC